MDRHGVSPDVPSARWRIVGLAFGLLVAIVGPFLVWGSSIEAWAHAMLDTQDPGWTLAAIAVALLASDLLLPVPSSVVAVAAGVAFGALSGTALVTVGLTLGSWVGYELGRSGGRAGIRRWVPDDQRLRLERFMQRHGLGLLVALRAVPVLAEASVVVAGAGGLRRARVLGVTAAANVVLGALYAGFGAWAANAEQLEIAAMASLGGPGLAMLLARRLPMK